VAGFFYVKEEKKTEAIRTGIVEDIEANLAARVPIGTNKLSGRLTHSI